MTDTSNRPVRVLIVEDEPSFLEALRVGLGREGFAVDVARDGRDALVRFEAAQPDIILLDVMLPRLSGIDVCREIRLSSDVPIIMVTAKGEEIDAVLGLEIGADDYITKPYRFRELVARMRALLRRAGSEAGGGVADEAPAAAGEAMTVNGVRVDSARHEVVVDGEPIDMPLKEFQLLEVLISRAGRVVSRDQLIDDVWGYDYVGDTKTLDVHIKRLRTKVEADPSAPQRIVTIRGLGYKFAD